MIQSVTFGQLMDSTVDRMMNDQDFRKNMEEECNQPTWGSRTQPTQGKRAQPSRQGEAAPSHHEEEILNHHRKVIYTNSTIIMSRSFSTVIGIQF